jgi:hypothetical protein
MDGTKQMDGDECQTTMDIEWNDATVRRNETIVEWNGTAI